MNRILSFLIVFLFSGCLENLTNYNEVPLNEEFEIRYGESVHISQYGVTIKFAAVEDDSRCPIDAICIWEGNAIVVLKLTNSTGEEKTAKLNTSLDPKQVEFFSLIIELKGLKPYPKSDEIIEQKDYTAQLLVKKKEN